MTAYTAGACVERLASDTEINTMAGTKGEVEYAVRRALNKFDEWNDVTGVIAKHTGYYYEIQSVIEDAVHCGFQRALGDEQPLPSEDALANLRKLF